MADKSTDIAPSKDTGVFAPKSAEQVAKDAESAREASGRQPQALEAAKTADEHAEASRTEDAPVPDKNTPKKGVANDANPDEVAGASDSGPNYMSTAGLNAFQKARVNGTPIDGALGSAVLGAEATRTADRVERLRSRAESK